MILNLTKLKSFFFLFPYFAMIVVGLMIPSDGNHGIMTPKSLSFFGSLLFFLGFILIKGRVTLYQLKMFIFTGAMIIFLMVWLFIGFTNDPSDWNASLDQFKIFIITIAFVMMTLYLVSEQLLLPETIIKIMILTNFSYSLIKLVLIALHYFNIVDLFALMETLDMRFMSMDVTAGLSRFQTSVDIVTPFFMLFVLQSKFLNLDFSKWFKCLYCLVSLFSILFSFSRFLMAVAFCSAFFYMMTLNKKEFLKALSFLLLLVMIFIYSIGMDTFLILIERRLLSHDNYYSDLTRTLQMNALIHQFFETPYFGMGLGGYVKNFVRDHTIQHSYEVQWLAFLMQFGLVGITILLIPIGYICMQFLKVFSKVHLSFLALFVIWLSSGFTNPFLISLASGIIYSIFLLAANILNREKINNSSY